MLLRSLSTGVIRCRCRKQRNRPNRNCGKSSHKGRKPAPLSAITKRTGQLLQAGSRFAASAALCDLAFQCRIRPFRVRRQGGRPGDEGVSSPPALNITTRRKRGREFRVGPRLLSGRFVAQRLAFRNATRPASDSSANRPEFHLRRNCHPSVQKSGIELQEPAVTERGRQACRARTGAAPEPRRDW